MANPANAPLGLLTSSDVALQLRYQELLLDIGVYNQGTPSFLGTFCRQTVNKEVRVSQAAQRFRRAPKDFAVDPQWDRHAYRDITLPTPVAYQLAAGVTREAIERGISLEEVSTINADSINAHTRALQQLVLQSMLLSGGFWDGSLSLAPPAFKQNAAFTTSHNHYLAIAASQSGSTGVYIPTLTILNTARTHLVHHGYGLSGGLVHLINSANAATIVNQAEWNTTANYVSTPTIADLQAKGIIQGQPFNTGAGIVSVEDWVPPNYILTVDTSVAPVHWRETEGADGRGLIVDVDQDFVKRISKYRFYGSAKVTQRSAGVVTYLASGTWADYTGFEV